MTARYLHTYSTPDVLAAQEHYYGRSRRVAADDARDPLGPREIDFISKRESFYMATVTADGWPYLQHRGGDVGFLRVIDQSTLAFADFRGNRQLLSTGNLAGNDRVSLFLMDYPNRARLKILGRARVLDAREHPALAARLGVDSALRDKVERAFVVDVQSYDWNCSQYITPRYSVAELEVMGVGFG
jgi:predicted pyridoxine 5'-phosphate oxidase superfamily flavin-nucleotide-binding protein